MQALLRGICSATLNQKSLKFICFISNVYVVVLLLWVPELGRWQEHDSNTVSFSVSVVLHYIKNAFYIKPVVAPLYC